MTVFHEYIFDIIPNLESIRYASIILYIYSTVASVAISINIMNNSLQE